MDDFFTNKVSVSKEIERRRKLAVFLKRKRVEQHKTLEDVAKGVCTVSYLSRIENNVVDVDEQYLIPLFKNVDVNYEELRESKNQDIYLLIIENYLERNTEELKRIITDAVNSNFYASFELELMLLFDNVYNNVFKEAKNIITSLNEKQSFLEDIELNFYQFLSVYYAYKTKQGLTALNYVLQMFQMIDETNPFYYAVYDLGLDIFFFNGRIDLFYKYYHLVMNERFVTTHKNLSIKHQLQKMYYEEKYSPELVNEMNFLIDKSDDKFKDDMFDIVCKKMFGNDTCDNFLKFVKEHNKTATNIALLMLNTMLPDGSVLYEESYRIFSDFNFTIADSDYELFSEIPGFVVPEANYLSALNDCIYAVKRQIESSNDYFFYNIIKKIMIQLALRLGKYRDVVYVLKDEKPNYKF